MVKVLRDALSSQLTNREQALVSSSGSSTSSSQERRDQCVSPKTVKLLFANKSEKDILWKEELAQFSKTSHGQ